MIVSHYRSGPHATGEPGYRPICNIETGGRRPDGFVTYDDQSHVLARNEAYCELSALSATNLDELNADDAVGLCHYRRVFSAHPPRGLDALPGVRRVAEFDWARLAIYGSDAATLHHRLSDQDWATAFPWDVRESGHASLHAQFVEHHPPELLDIADRACARQSGLREGDFQQFLRTSTQLVPYNMFIAKIRVLREYLSFLWPVLSHVDALAPRIVDLDDSYQRRYAGFLAERIMTYWLTALDPPRSVDRLDILLLDQARILNSSTGEHEGDELRRHRAAASVPGLARVHNSRQRRRYISRINRTTDVPSAVDPDVG